VRRQGRQEDPNGGKRKGKEKVTASLKRIDVKRTLLNQRVCEQVHYNWEDGGGTKENSTEKSAMEEDNKLDEDAKGKDAEGSTSSLGYSTWQKIIKEPRTRSAS